MLFVCVFVVVDVFTSVTVVVLHPELEIATLSVHLRKQNGYVVTP